MSLGMIYHPIHDTIYPHAHLCHYLAIGVSFKITLLEERVGPPVTTVIAHARI